MINFKPIQLEDKDVIEKYLLKEQNMGCEMCFSSLYIWRKAFDMRYAIIDDCLVLWSKDGQNPAGLRFPVGNGNRLEAAKKACDYMISVGEKPQFYGVTSDVIKFIKANSDQYEFGDMSKYSDYVYETEKMISLSGKKLHSKKNHLNRFKRAYKYEYALITAKDKDDILKAYEGWADLGDDKYLLAEREAIGEITQNIDVLGIKGAMLKVDGEIVAFTFGDKLTNDMAVIHIEKANTAYDGAYAAINQMFAENEWSSFKYLNREDDCGLEGLEKAKKSYQPVFMVEKYKVTRR